MQEFTHQDYKSGRFIETPEYPEFPWYEGTINAVAHRDWAATGQFIKVSMYDDRLEIESPGRFSDIVTSENIGVLWNKIYAKLGSDYKKPDAITVFDRENYRRFVYPLPASDLLYVGARTAKKLERIGILICPHSMQRQTTT